MFQKILTFLKEVKTELKRVNWPSRQETLRYTIIVIGFSAAVALILSSFDFVYSSILRRLII